MKALTRRAITFAAFVFFCQEATALTDDQLAKGCWQTKSACLKTSTPRLKTRENPDDRYRRKETIISSKFRNRCGGPVFIRVLFGLPDGEFDTMYLFLADKNQETVSNRRPMDLGLYTGEMVYAWIGVPKIPRGARVIKPYDLSTFLDGYSTHFCETELFEDLEYDLKQ